MTIIEKIHSHNEARLELTEALAQTFEDVDTYEHLLPALLADSQQLTHLKHRHWYAQLREYLPGDLRLERAQQLETQVNKHLCTIESYATGSASWLNNIKQLNAALLELNACDMSLAHLVARRLSTAQLDNWGTQLQRGFQQNLIPAHVA